MLSKGIEFVISNANDEPEEDVKIFDGEDSQVLGTSNSDGKIEFEECFGETLKFSTNTSIVKDGFCTKSISSLDLDLVIDQFPPPSIPIQLQKVASKKQNTVRGKKILEQLSMQRFFTGFKIRALFPPATQRDFQTP